MLLENKLNLLLAINAAEGIGGGPIHVLILAKYLNKEKYNIFVTARKNGDFEKDVINAGAIPIDISFSRKFSLSVLIKYIKLLKKYRIQIIHSHGAPVSFYSRLARKFLEFPAIITTYHISIERITDINRFQKNIYKIVDRIGSISDDKIIAVSNAVKESLISECWLPSCKIEVVYNGIDIPRFSGDTDGSKIIEELNLTSEDKIIGIVARLSHEKSHITLIKAMKKVIKDVPNVKLLIVGDGPLKVSLMRSVKKMKLNDFCFFLGIRKNIPEIISCLDVAVLSSVTEGLPISLIEAMTSGKCVVGTDVGGIPEVIDHGENGLLIPPNDPEKLAEALIYLLNNPDIAKKMGEKGIKIAKEEFSYQIMIKKIERIYDESIRQ